MKEQRQHLRLSSSALVEVTHPSIGSMDLKAKDLSEGGVFVFLGNYIALPVGTVIKARIRRHTGPINAEPVDMQVVHHHSGGMGLKFI